MQLQKPVFKRVGENIEFKVPETPMYYFESRRSYRIIPVWTTWQVARLNKPEMVFQLDCTVIYNEQETKVERFTISSLEKTFQMFLDRESSKTVLTSEEKIIHKLLNFPEDGARTKERFEQDLAGALSKLGEIQAIPDEQLAKIKAVFQALAKAEADRNPFYYHEFSRDHADTYWSQMEDKTRIYMDVVYAGGRNGAIEFHKVRVMGHSGLTGEERSREAIEERVGFTFDKMKQDLESLGFINVIGDITVS